MRPTFDCHNLSYIEVEDKLPNWILMNQKHMPLDIITGISAPMRVVCLQIIADLKFESFIPHHNQGMITIIS